MSESLSQAASRNVPADRPPTFAVVKLRARDSESSQIEDLHKLLVAHPSRTLREWLQSLDESLPALPPLLEWEQLDQNIRISAAFKSPNTEVIQRLRASRGRPAKEIAGTIDPAMQQYIRFEINPFDSEAIGTLERLKDVLDVSEGSTVESIVLGGSVGEAPNGAVMRQPFSVALEDGGIGIRQIHGKYPGSYGENTWFVDVEQGWSLPHDELNGRYFLPTISGVNRDWIWSSSTKDFVPVGWHGLMILGLVAANHTSGELTGIAPASYGFLAAEWEKLVHTPYTANTAQAIKAAADLLDPGDVILIEGQRYFADLGCNLPVEADPAVFEAILYATSQDITVIEPAGNNGGGGVCLDDFTHPKPPGLFERDSGAILVAAANITVNRSNPAISSRDKSNFGKKVNCFADGDNIFALDPPGRAGDSCNGYFSVEEGGTSTAAATIAGVALVLQGIQRAQGFVISAPKMRQLLSDKNNGDEFEPNAVKNRYGVMPILTKLEAAKGGTLQNLGDVPI